MPTSSPRHQNKRKHRAARTRKLRKELAKQMETDTDLSHRTAIHRKTASAPTRWLWERGHLRPDQHTLDYGCGRGADTAWLEDRGVAVQGFDPHYAPDPIALIGKYARIVCNYVLNVVGPDARLPVLQAVQDALESDGVAYVTVRSDVEASSHGVTTGRGTVQYDVRLDLPIVHKGSGFRTYELTKLSVLN